MPGRGSEVISIPDSLWRRPETFAALRSRDVGALFRLLRQYAGSSQTQIAIACGMTQGKVSETMKKGGRQVLTLEVFERIADGLKMPDQARMTLGLTPRTFKPAPTQPPTVIRPGDEPTGLGTASISDSLDLESDVEQEEDPLRRRTFTRLAGASLFNAILAEPPGTGTRSEGVEAFAAALVGYPDTVSALPSGPLDLPALQATVASAKRDYQGCRYSAVTRSLPRILAHLRIACESSEGDDRLKAEALSAEAHHVAASILLKFDAEGVAWVAADRSMQAAQASQDPTTLGSSARIITHALMNDGHHRAATTTASNYAQRIERDMDTHTPGSLSVYGSLLLRGAVAAAQHNNRAAATTLLDEAQEAARRLGGDFNYRWTAFGPTNVKLHRVNVALLLGDAGAAVQEARSIELDGIELTERKASLLIDISRALAQWGKHDKAYEILRAAHHLAPEEVATRPSVHRMLTDLHATAPPTTKRKIQDFTAQRGIPL